MKRPERFNNYTKEKKEEFKKNINHNILHYKWILENPKDNAKKKEYARCRIILAEALLEDVEKTYRPSH